MIEVEKEKQNAPHGSKECVPVRSAGNNEEVVDKNRATYGEDPAFILKSGEVPSKEPYDVNNVKTRVNVTKDDEFITHDSFCNHGMAP